MKRAAPARATLIGSTDSANAICNPVGARNQIQPVERHWPPADDKLVEPEVPRIQLLAGKAQGPGRLGDLMRAARRP
jgi:hypothetical protein